MHEHVFTTRINKVSINGPLYQSISVQMDRIDVSVWVDVSNAVRGRTGVTESEPLAMMYGSQPVIAALRCLQRTVSVDQSGL